MRSKWPNQSFDECIEENFGKTPVDCSNCYNLQERPFWQLCAHIIITAIIIIISLFGNVLFFVLLLKYKKLRNRSSVYSISVILANTGLVLSFHVQVMLSTLTEGWVFEFLGCQIFGFFSTQFVFTRWLNMGVLAIDRFCAVRFPFLYPKHSKAVSVGLIASSWVLPILFSVVTVQGYASVAFRSNIPACLYYSPTVANGKPYFSVVFTSCFVLGGVLPLLLYSWLFYKAMKFRNSLKDVGTMTINNSTQSVIETQDNQGSYSNERKAIITFALIFVAFCLTGAPIYIFQLIRWIQIDIWCEIPHMVHFQVIELFLSATLIDPFLLMRDGDIQKRLRHLLYCHNNCGKYYNNRSEVCPDLPPERNFDAIRIAASRAANLVSLSGSVDNIRSASASKAVPYRLRTGSVPTSDLTSYRRSLSELSRGLKEERKKEINDNLLKHSLKADSMHILSKKCLEQVQKLPCGSKEEKRESPCKKQNQSLASDSPNLPVKSHSDPVQNMCTTKHCSSYSCAERCVEVSIVLEN